jgi:exosortase/archaeosortase family protein
MNRLAALLALLAAGWPVLRWYALRLGDGSDEPWGLAALAAALLFAPWRSLRQPLAPRRALGLAASLFVYALAWPWMPPLARALLFVSLVALVLAPAPSLVPSLALTLSPSSASPARSPLLPPPRSAIPLWSLLVLSLPVVATLQFYLGYPLRVVTTWLCVPLIRLLGATATASGTTLSWAGERVIVDAPCSGIHMLWTGLFCAAGLACWHELDARRTFALAQVAATSVFVANILRATVLFFTESGQWPAPAWIHDGAGLGLFAVAATIILAAVGRLALKMPPGRAAAPAQPPRRRRQSRHLPPPRCLAATVALAALAAGTAPAWSARMAENARAARAQSAAAAFPGWEAGPVSADWVQKTFGEREARFARDFPGKTAVFTDDAGHTRIVRWLGRPTRRLHPAAYCLRALGYETSPRPILQKPDGSIWSATEARRSGSGQRLLVYERITGADGQAWTDVSAWYWTALFGRARGPWWTVTELAPGKPE